MTDTLLVTGGSGFVLSHLVRQWLDSVPRSRAVVVDAAPMDAAARDWFGGVEDRLTFVQGSVADPAVWKALPSDAITHIVHGSAVTSISRLLDDGFSAAVPALETNLMGPVHALAFAAQCPKLKRMVHVSTGSVYGVDGPVPEDDPMPEEGFIDPDGYYGISKFAGEQLAVQSARQLGLPVVAVRLSSVFGPMDRETPARAVAMAPAILMRRALAGERVKVTDLGGAGDYIHAGDVALAIRALFDAPKLNHAVYNVANGARYTMGELVNLVAASVPGFEAEIAAESDADIVIDPARTGGRWNAYDVSRMRADTGWTPFPLKDTLRDYRDWLLAGI